MHFQGKKGWNTNTLPTAWRKYASYTCSCEYKFSCSEYHVLAAVRPNMRIWSTTSKSFPIILYLFWKALTISSYYDTHNQVCTIAWMWRTYGDHTGTYGDKSGTSASPSPFHWPTQHTTPTQPYVSIPPNLTAPPHLFEFHSCPSPLNPEQMWQRVVCSPHGWRPAVAGREVICMFRW